MGSVNRVGFQNRKCRRLLFLKGEEAMKYNILQDLVIFNGIQKGTAKISDAAVYTERETKSTFFVFLYSMIRSFESIEARIFVFSTSALMLVFPKVK